MRWRATIVAARLTVLQNRSSRPASPLGRWHFRRTRRRRRWSFSSWLIPQQRAWALTRTAGSPQRWGWPACAPVALPRPVDRLRLALAAEPDPNRRATLHALTSEIHLTRLEADEMIGEARKGLAELGRWLPSNPVLLLVATVWLFARGLLVQWLRVGRGTATGAERERCELEVALTGIAAIAAVRSRRRFLMSCFDLRLVYPANRLGLSLPYVRAFSLLAGGLRVVGLARWGDRLFERMYRDAARLNDPRATASVAWFDGLVRFVLYDDRHETREILRRVLIEHGRWLGRPGVHSGHYWPLAVSACPRLPAGVNDVARAGPRSSPRRAGARRGVPARCGGEFGDVGPGRGGHRAVGCRARVRGGTAGQSRGLDALSLGRGDDRGRAGPARCRVRPCHRRCSSLPVSPAPAVADAARPLDLPCPGQVGAVPGRVRRAAPGPARCGPHRGW